MMFGIPKTEWAINAAFDFWRTPGKDGDRWFVQFWHPTSPRSCILSHRGWRPVVIR